MLYSEFCSKEVINLCDCQRLGRVVDFEMDECDGRILKLMVAKSGKWCSFFAPDVEYTIDFCDIRQIGPDVILVELKGSRCTDRCKRREREKNHCCC